jgi:adenosine deaminase
MPPVVLAELLNRYDIGDVLRTTDDRHLALLQGYDNLRPFLRPRNWTEQEVTQLFRYQSFDNFLLTFGFVGLFIRTADDLRLLIRGVLNEFARQRVVYSEISISAIEYVARGLPLSQITECLEEAAEHPRVRVQWIVDLVRDYGPECALAQVKELIALRSPAVIGITIGGSEHHYPPAQFREAYALARDRGLRVSVHAGEAAGPESVWDALRVIGAERIGHGVRAVEDPALVDHLAEHQIPLEVCPTSNLFTGVYPSYQSHPAKALFAAGVPITVNSDDPTFFRTTLADEYACLAQMGFSADEVVELLRNGFRYSFLPESERTAYLSELDSQSP